MKCQICFKLISWLMMKLKFWWIKKFEWHKILLKRVCEFRMNFWLLSTNPFVDGIAEWITNSHQNSLLFFAIFCWFLKCHCGKWWIWWARMDNSIWGIIAMDQNCWFGPGEFILNNFLSTCSNTINWQGIVWWTMFAAIHQRGNLGGWIIGWKWEQN